VSAGRGVRRAVSCRRHPAQEVTAEDVWLAYELGEANERDRWHRQVQRIIDALDNGTVQQLLDE
jgi:hypothetical protein